MTRAILPVLLAVAVACAKPVAPEGAPSPDSPSADTSKPAAPAEPSQPAAPADYPLEAAPAELKPAVDRAEAAIKTVKGALGQRMMEEMKAGGPSKAITVCRDEAPAITASVSGGVKVGRTAARLRNPKNTAPAWLAGMLEQTATAKAKDVQPRVYDLGDRIGLVKPIGSIGVCLKCHGAPDSMDAAIKETIAASYPDDRATGFDTGDLRGLFWAEAEK
jgi:hypothetical protein